MKNKYKKGAFIITLVLLLITLPLTIIGIIFKNNGRAENPNKEFYYDNHLYFYNSDEELLAKYECMFKNCGYAIETNLDNDYGINYYKTEDKIIDGIIDNKYAFISDYKDEQKSVTLYDLEKNDIYASYKSVKNYGIGIMDNYYIVQSITGTYGVIKIDNGKVENVLPFVYEYIALQNDIDLEQNKIVADTFIVKKDNKWNLVDKNEAELTNGSFYPITAFDTETYIMKNENYKIYNYNGIAKMAGDYKYLNYISRYIEVKDSSNNYYILNKDNMTLASKIYPTSDDSIISTKINSEDKLEIIIDNESKEIIEIS